MKGCLQWYSVYVLKEMKNGLSDNGPTADGEARYQLP